MLDRNAVEAQATEVRACAGGPINLNFFCHEMPAAGGLRPMWAGQAARLAPALQARDLAERLGAEALALLRRRR